MASDLVRYGSIFIGLLIANIVASLTHPTTTTFDKYEMLPDGDRSAYFHISKGWAIGCIRESPLHRWRPHTDGGPTPHTLHPTP